VVSGSIGFTHLNKTNAKRQVNGEAFKNSFRGTSQKISVKGTNPISLKYEYALTKRFGLGLSISWWSVLVNVKDYYSTGTGSDLKDQVDTYDYKMTSVSFGIRPNYHIPIQDKKADLFFGCAFGLAKNDMSVTFSSTQSTGVIRGSFFELNIPNTLYIAPTLGYRRYLTSNFGLNLELGYEKGAVVLAGIVFRFRPLKYEPPDN